MKIKFVDNSEQSYISAVETEEFYNGSSRRTLTFVIDPEDCNLQELSNLCTEINTVTLELINEEEDIHNIYEGYVLKLNVGIESRFDEQSGSYIDRVILKLGKRTFIEQRLHEVGII